MDDGGRVVPDALVDDLHISLQYMNVYRALDDSPPITRRQWWRYRINAAVWDVRWRLARLLYPFTERDD